MPIYNQHNEFVLRAIQIKSSDSNIILAVRKRGCRGEWERLMHQQPAVNKRCIEISIPGLAAGDSERPTFR